MKKFLLFILVILCTIVVFLIFKKSNNYIVGIENETSNSILNGSGIAYKCDRDKCYIVTNYHIVANSKKLYIYNSKKERISAKIEKYDDYTDIAIISVENYKLHTTSLDNCNYNINDIVIVKGYNIKKEGTIIDKDVKLDVPNMYGNSVYNTFMIDYDGNYGDSGSAIVDKKNKVIGLLSVMDKETKYGYAIPICEVNSTIEMLMNDDIYRPNLEAQFTNSESDIKGILILNIYDNSELKELNIQKGYIITKVNNIPVENISKFRNELYKYSKGDIIDLEYYDNMDYKNIYITLK